jgi:copper resistance protein B
MAEAMRLALPAALLLVAAPAAAERLPYNPVTDETVAGAEPRLTPRQVEEDNAPSEGGKLLRWGLVDRFEYAAQRGRDGYSWDFSALIGGKRNRLWLASVGEGPAWAGPDYLEFHALYSRHVGGNVDLNLGLRWDAIPRPRRAYATLGAQYDDDTLWLGAFGYVSDEGEPGARLAALYNASLTKKLIAQPSVELDWIGEDVPELGLGRGFYYAEAGLRLRYEFEDYFAPYVGVSWERSLGRTAEMEREAGEDPETKSLVLGVRSSF